MDSLDRRIDLLHRLTGASSLVLMAFLIFPERSLKFSDLLRVTGKSKPTTLDALRVLGDLGLVQKHAGSGWAITARCRQLTLGDGDESEQGKNILPSCCSSSKDSEYKEESIDPTTTTGVKIFYPTLALRNPAVDAMRDHGIFPNLAAELGEDEWITVERVEQEAAHLAADKSVRNLAAVLYANLKAHVDRGPVKAKRQPGHRFIEAEYADFIDH